MTHPPPKRGGSLRRFCCCGCFTFSSFPCPRGSVWSNDELLLDSKDLIALVRGGLFGFGGFVLPRHCNGA